MKNHILKLSSLLLFAVLLFACNKDKTDPVLTLLGENPVNICVGFDYQDAGAVATDDEDGNISDKIVTTGDIDTNMVGTYTVYYSVEDNAGNRAEATRTVEVIQCK